MMKKFKRFLALLLVLVLFLGDLGPDHFMMLSAYADDESAETAVTETPAVAETPAPTEEPAATATPAPALPAETEAPSQTAEPETPEASAAPVADGETTDESGETPAPSAAPAVSESADTKPARRVSDEIKLDAATTLTIEGVLPAQPLFRLSPSLYQFKQPDAGKEALYRLDLWVFDGASVFSSQGSYILTLKGESIRKRIEDGSFRNLRLVYDAQHHEASLLRTDKDSISFTVAKLELFVLYLYDAEAAAAALAEAPAETPAPAETSAPAETETPAETEAPVETEAPAETQAPVETGTPVETEAPADTVPGEKQPAEGDELAQTPAESALESLDTPGALRLQARGGSKTAPFLAEFDGSYAAASFTGSYRTNKGAPDVDAREIDAGELYSVLDAWSAEELNNQTELSVSVTIHSLPLLNEGESLALYSLKNGALESVLLEDPALGDEVTLALSRKGENGVALVKRAEADAEGNALQRFVPDDALFANDELYLTGKMPKNAVVVATPVQARIDGLTVLAAYDITIYANAQQQAKDHPWQPAGDKVQVHLLDEALREQSAVKVFHLADEEQEAEYVDTVPVSGDGSVSFEAEGFSTYIFATLTTEIEASDGNTYRVSVSYDETAGIPADAVLAVSEISSEDAGYETYLRGAEEALTLDTLGYTRLFDITITDASDPAISYQPLTEVAVSISLLNDCAPAQDFSVVHFHDGAQVLDAVTDGSTVSFMSDGFSAYAIVSGPTPGGTGWMTLQTMADFDAHAAVGVYPGHSLGFYFRNFNFRIDNSRTGITKTKPAQTYPSSEASLYYFEKVEGTTNQYYAWCYSDGGVKQYVRHTGKSLMLTETESERTAFTVSATGGGQFTLADGGFYWNMQGGVNGNSFAAYDNGGDANSKITFWYKEPVTDEPYGLNGKTYGLMSYSGGVAGKALMSESSAAGTLNALSLTVLTRLNNRTDTLFVPDSSDISLWRFSWLEDDLYRLTTTVDGSTRYLRLGADGLSLVSEPDEACTIQIIPGSGDHAGDICLKNGSTTLTYTGSVDTGFTVNGSAGTEWLKLVTLSELSEDYFMTYSASKVSVSDPGITDGSSLIVYTRAWNDTTKKYEFYAIDHDGSLIPCFENGDSIQWVGNRINSLLWNFVEYRDETTGEPTYYYELYNPYSDKYLAPQLTGSQLVSPNTLGINLNGRRNGYYYTSILGWDTAAYQYAGLKVEDGRIVPCPIGDAEDFYFAIMQDLQVDDQLTEVPTVDHTQYGITMKVIDFRSRDELSDFLGSDDGGAVIYTVPNLLSNSLGPDGYPMAHGGSLGTLFAGAREVNHLFIASTYSGSGYYEFDSTQNFASLQSNNNFKVYKELGTYDSGGNKPTLKHGQFFPFNDLKAGLFASVNGKNQYTATASPLPANDPRRDERLYLIQNVNTQFGVEIEATFTQTPNGLDAWGHDIIYQFTGDDDFWLYVNGELVIDLGGIHSALPGSVNFSTGDVYVNGVHSTLKDIYYNNAIARGESASDAQAYVDDLFIQNSEGNWIFKEYSTNTMRLFFMERGAGASNLYMRFNLASVKPGTVELSKELSGVDDSESVLAQFPYQVWYTTDEHPEGLLLADTNKVTFKDTITRVPYKPTIEIDGHTYDSVFLLRPGEIATIELPEDTVNYKIVECGVNEHVYSNVYVNGAEVTGQGTDGRKDYAIPYASTASRARVAYVNKVNPDALRTLSITKELFNESGETELRTDNATFNFRLYFGTEFDSTLTLANMYTYHVKDQNGNYCTWNASLGRFESIGVGNYGDLTDTQKAAASFTTSMNGSVGSIPPFYTVEVRQLLAGTNYKVEERANEIPDGYSLQKYVLDGNDCGETPPQGEIVIGQDPDVAVRNLRGWGLRVYKQWSDQDYMATRDDAYFAVFTRENGILNLVEGSMRRLSMNENTLYWYFQRLKSGVDFADYVIREVNPVNPVTDADGVVTAGSYTILEHNDEIEINGRQKGESESSLFRYTVLYTLGEIQEDSNVRVDAINNNRPGIELRKQLWNGTPLPGAVFTLHDSAGSLIGSFTSDSTGLITVAFLRDGVDYILTESATPQAIHGLEAPMTIRLSGGTVTVSGVDAENYILTQGAGQTPTLIIRNRPFTLTAVKQGVLHDGTTELLAGVHFALHREVTIGGIVSMDFNPMPGYEDLVTDSGGVIPLVTQDLPVGSYYLKENSRPEGFESISAPIRFTISANGTLTLSRTESAELQTTIAADGTLQYTLVVKNIQVLPAPTGITAFLRPFAILFAFGLGLALLQLFRRRGLFVSGPPAEAETVSAQTPSGTEGRPGTPGRASHPGQNRRRQEKI